MANDGDIAKDTLFEPERIQAPAIDWDRSDRGLSSGRAATGLQSRRRIHGRNRNYASINRNALAPREPSIQDSKAGLRACQAKPGIWHEPQYCGDLAQERNS